MTVDDSLSMLRLFLPRADSAQLTVSKLSKGKVIFTAAIFTLADPSLAARTRVTYLRLVTRRNSRAALQFNRFYFYRYVKILALGHGYYRSPSRVYVIFAVINYGITKRLLARPRDWPACFIEQFVSAFLHRARASTKQISGL